MSHTASFSTRGHCEWPALWRERAPSRRANSTPEVTYQNARQQWIANAIGHCKWPTLSTCVRAFKAREPKTQPFLYIHKHSYLSGGHTINPIFPREVLAFIFAWKTRKQEQQRQTCQKSPCKWVILTLANDQGTSDTYSSRYWGSPVCGIFSTLVKMYFRFTLQ